MDPRQSSKKSKKKEHGGIWKRGESSGSKTKEHGKSGKSESSSNNKKTRADSSSDKLPRKSSGRSFGQVIGPLTRRSAGFTRATSFSLRKKRQEPSLSHPNYEQKVVSHNLSHDSPQQCVSRTYKSSTRTSHWAEGSNSYRGHAYNDYEEWEIDIPEIAIQDYSTFYNDDVEDQTDYFRQAQWAIQLLEDHLDHDLHVSVVIKPIQGTELELEETNKVDTCTACPENEESSDFRRGLSSLIYPLSSGAATIVQKGSRVADLTNRLFRSMHIDIIRKRRALTTRQESAEANTSTNESTDYVWNKVNPFSKSEKDNKRVPLQD